MNESFYRDLDTISDFSFIFDEDIYKEIPEDWIIVMTDIIESTKAIDSGKYKQVNAAGSLSAMAITNILGDMQFPFVFGGDGMTILLPPSFADKVKPILASTIRIVHLLFELELRAAVIPVNKIVGLNKKIQIAKLKVSKNYNQALISGEGITEAEKFLKSENSLYRINANMYPGVEADYSGYTCRWQDYPSGLDVTAAIIVKFRNLDNAINRTLFSQINAILGNSEEQHPLRAKDSRIAWNKEILENEAFVLSGTQKGLMPVLLKLKIRIEIIFTVIFVKFKIHYMHGKKEVWNTKTDNITSSDYRKFDDSLKMIVSLTNESVEQLKLFLEKEYSKGNLFYGFHIAQKATITCLMHAESGNEVHFVDAAGGGYAYAAVQLKKQMK